MKNEDLGRFYPSKKKPDSGKDNFIRKSDNNGGGGSADFSTVTGVTYNTTDGADITYDGGSNLTLPIKGGNGINVGAASDNKSLEVKVGDTINITANQSITFNNAEYDTPIFKLTSDSIDLDPLGGDAITFKVAGQTSLDILNKGPNIQDCGVAICDGYGAGATFNMISPYYEIGGVPTSSTSGTFPDNESWTYLTYNPEGIRIHFNNEFYQLADNQHTTGTLVFSHVGYENGSFIIKTITITLATREWVLTAGKVTTTPLE